MIGFGKVWSIYFDWVWLRTILFGLFRLGLSKFGLVELCLVRFWFNVVDLGLFRISLVSLVRNFTNRKKSLVWFGLAWLGLVWFG